jgi:signal transduction histidine kinase
MTNRKVTKDDLLREVEQLRAERDELRELLNLAPFAVGVTRGPEHVLSAANRQLSAEIGRDALGEPFRDAFPTLADSGPHAALDAVFGSGSPQRTQAFALTREAPDGTREERFVDVHHAPMHDPEGAVAAVASFALDVTERVRMQRQVDYLLGELRTASEELNRLSLSSEAPKAAAAPGREAELCARIAELEQQVAYRGDVVDLVTQELRTPLHVLMGFGSILRKEVHGTLSARQHDHLTKLLGAAQVMATLVDDLLDMGRAKRGELPLSPQILDFTELLESAIAASRPEAASRHHHLEVDIAGSLPILYADHERVQRVVAELLANAIKFTPEGGVIRVHARHEDRHVMCEVEDSGEGIAPEMLARILEPFSPIEPALACAGSGAGVGLSLSRAVLEAHGGTLQVESERGRGSLFRMRLPALGSNRFLGQRFS